MFLFSPFPGTAESQGADVALSACSFSNVDNAFDSRLE